MLNMLNILNEDFNIEDLLLLWIFLDLCEYCAVSAADLTRNQENASDARQHICVMEGYEMNLYYWVIALERTQDLIHLSLDFYLI